MHRCGEAFVIHIRLLWLTSSASGFRQKSASQLAQVWLVHIVSGGEEVQFLDVRLKHHILVPHGHCGIGRALIAVVDQDSGSDVETAFDLLVEDYKPADVAVRLREYDLDDHLKTGHT
jgi:hypothetical protein